MPIPYAPAAGEALDSWLEFLAARLHCRYADVLRSLGLPMRDVTLAKPMLPRWAVLATGEETPGIAAVAGIAEKVLTAMTLRRFDGRAVAIQVGQRRVERRSLWGRAGSRFCPSCLSDSKGRWQVTWQLSWSFACTRHQVVLADRCPACQRIPRLHAHPRREIPRPGLCASPAPNGPRGRRCHHPLRAKSVSAAGQAAQWLTERVAATGRALHPGNVASLGGTVSPSLQAALRCSREAKVMPVARLRHRTAVASTRSPGNQDARARMLPNALWPEWSLRLAPWHPSGKPVARRVDELLAVACLLVGNSTAIRAAAGLTGTTVSSHNVASLLAELTRRRDCAGVLHALVLLADHLDQHGSPIDYARRRALFIPRARFITPERWYDLQRRMRANHLPDITHANRWIFHTLTGTPPRLAHPSIAPTTPSQRQQYLRFRWRILPAEAELLTHTARAILDEHDIDEPLQWAPRLAPTALRPLTLPGPAPDSITVAQLHQAVPVGDFSIAQVAHRLNTTTAHVIYLLSRHPVDWSPPGSGAPSTPPPASGNGAPGTNTTNSPFTTSPTAKGRAWLPCVLPSSRTMSRSAHQEASDAGCEQRMGPRRPSGDSAGSAPCACAHRSHPHHRMRSISTRRNLEGREAFRWRCAMSIHEQHSWAESLALQLVLAEVRAPAGPHSGVSRSLLAPFPLVRPYLRTSVAITSKRVVRGTRPGCGPSVASVGQATGCLRRNTSRRRAPRRHVSCWS
ncbi:TniQ family protein [Streptomyces sp. NPDC052114]|uniref:TniQ family protein n=1 Tax=unclassified Streptomyces TaxID=2593676 RepID=UPI003444FB34